MCRDAQCAIRGDGTRCLNLESGVGVLFFGMLLGFLLLAYDLDPWREPEDEGNYASPVAEYLLTLSAFMYSFFLAQDLQNTWLVVRSPTAI